MRRLTHTLIAAAVAPLIIAGACDPEPKGIPNIQSPPTVGEQPDAPDPEPAVDDG